MSKTENNIRFDFKPRLPTHIVLIRSRQSRQCDSKKFTLHAPEETTETLRAVLKHFMFSQQAGGNLPEYIQFANEKIKPSHFLMIMTSRSKGTVVDVSRGFSLYCPSYSSEEIANVIKEYLYGGKK